MPVVPVAQNTVGIAETTNAKLQAADFGAAGETIGRSLEQFGNQGSQFADQLFEQHQRKEAQFDDGAIKDSSNHLLSFYTQGGFTGDNPYFNMKGKSALLARPDFEKSLDSQVSEIRSGLTNDRQRRVFDQAVTPQVLSLEATDRGACDTGGHDLRSTGQRGSCRPIWQPRPQPVDDGPNARGRSDCDWRAGNRASGSAKRLGP